MGQETEVKTCVPNLAFFLPCRRCDSEKKILAAVVVSISGGTDADCDGMVGHPAEEEKGDLQPCSLGRSVAD